MKQFGKVLALFLWIMIAIIAGAGSLNSGIPFYMVCGGLNILINGAAVYFGAKKLELF
jgi:hypothetical protein